MSEYEPSQEIDPDEDENDLPEGPSKSQVKRDRLALQALAERMVTRMPRAQLERLHLSEDTWAAINETPRIKDLRALRRHWKRIANLLEREDLEAVQALMDEADERERTSAARHHELERWRTRMLEGDAQALGEFIDLCPWVDRQHLRHLVQAAQKDQARERPDGPRKLFRFLRETMDQAPYQS